MKRILALALLLAATLNSGCSSPQPDPNPGFKAHLHQTLTGHAAVVWQVAFSPGGEWLAGGGYDQALKVWRLESSPPPR